MKKSYGSFINPVFIMSAILKSIESGKWEKIEKKQQKTLYFVVFNLTKKRKKAINRVYGEYAVEANTV